MSKRVYPRSSSLGGASGQQATVVAPVSRGPARWVYVWLSNGDEFPILPMRIGPNSLSGWRWDIGAPAPSFYGFDLDLVQSFTCA